MKITQEKTVVAIFLGVPIQISGADWIKINDNVYDLTPELYRASSSTSYNGKTMKDDTDILMMYNNIYDLEYRSIGDKSSKTKTTFTIKLPKLVEEIQNKNFDEFDLEGQGRKIIFPSNIIDIYTRLEVSLRLNISGHTDTLTEASNLIDDLHKRGEIQNKQQ